MVVERGIEASAMLNGVLYIVRFRACVPRRIASDFSGFKARPL